MNEGLTGLERQSFHFWVNYIFILKQNSRLHGFLLKWLDSPTKNVPYNGKCERNDRKDNNNV